MKAAKMSHSDTMLTVGPDRLVAVRYVMKNARQEVLIDTTEQEPVRFVYGSGDILPALEGPLTGLKVGDRKSFVVLPDSNSGFDEAYHFDVIIANIAPLTEASANVSDSSPTTDICGPDCDC